MTHQEELSLILENSDKDRILPFLKSLSAAERKALVPELKKLQKYYWELISTSSNTYQFRANEAQQKILSQALLVCSDLKDSGKINANLILKIEVLDAIFQWYKPGWFSEYINGHVNDEWLPFSYTFLMEMTEKGYVQPSPALIAKALPPTISKRVGKEVFFTLEKLEKRPITLDEHIWYLFDHECGVNWADRWVKFKTTENIETNWMGVFKQYSDNGRISRDRVLKESLAASAKSFTKTLCGWHADLFTSLTPTTQELLSLQTQLMAALAGPQSKPANTVLGFLRKIVKDPLFDAETFIQQTQPLLSSEVKSIHTATLSLLETLAQKQQTLREQICLAATRSFISRDVTVQTTAARLIEKYGDPGSTVLREAVATFNSSLLTVAKDIMTPWLGIQTTEPAVAAMTSSVSTDASVLSDDRRIPILQNAEELIFLMSQAMDNNQHYHFEQLLSGILQFHRDISATHFEQMEPAMQRAFKVTQKGGSGNAGWLESLLALFLIEYGKLLEKQFPNVSGFRKQYKKTEEGGTKIVSIENWKSFEQSDGAYGPYKQLAQIALRLLRQDHYLPLLSLPTYLGGWIDPVVLVERLANYQTRGVSPVEIDLQLAIARVAFEKAEAALPLVQTSLSGEYKDLMMFLLDKEVQPRGDFSHPAWWMMAGLTKAPEKEYPEFAAFPYAKAMRVYLTGQFDWETTIEKYEAYGEYNMEKKEYDRYEAHRSRIHIIYPPGSNIHFKNVYGTKVAQLTPLAASLLLPEYMYDNRSLAFDNDIQRIFSLLPNHPDILLAKIIDSCMYDPNLYEVTEKKMVLRTLESLHILRTGPSEQLHLLLATAFLSQDATCRAIAAEIWIERVQHNTIDSQRIGAILGTHERVEWAPLKRFTDLATGQLMKISPAHNMALEHPLTACLLQLPGTGIKDLKKLLEIYYEVLVNNDSSVQKDQALSDKLKEWERIASLKKVARTILA